MNGQYNLFKLFERQLLSIVHNSELTQRRSKFFKKGDSDLGLEE